MLLFLGAGASKYFGIPVMEELTNVVMRELKSSYNRDLNVIHSIVRRIEKFGITPDIEAILTCIDALSNPSRALKNAGPFAGFIFEHKRPDELLSRYKTYSKKEDFKAIAKEIRSIIRKNCFYPSIKEYEKKIRDVYDTFFKALDFSLSKTLWVFTTNYDLCFERYLEMKNIAFYDGFDKRNRFNSDFMEAGGLQLYKLHGSSNWVVTEDCKEGEFTKTDTFIEVGEQTIRGRMVKDVMIYPTSEKYFSKSPYFELLNRFREYLNYSKKEKEKCIIIGYSFRDIPINNAFIDIFKEEHRCISYIDKKATKNVKNIPELVHVIRCFDTSFEKFSWSEGTEVRGYID